MQYTTEKDGTSSYYTHWGAGKNKDKVVIKQEVDNVERKFIEGMSKQVQNIGKNEWKISHAHINSMHLNASENLLFQWRSTVEAQGCQFIANVVFRDPLGHALSLHKHQAKCCSRANWSQHLYTQSELGHWEAQLDFFLYSKIDRNPHGVEPKEKVRRALELLQRHFDLVVVGDHDKYRNVILKLTGWEEKVMTRTNSYFGKLIFSKEDVQTIQKLIAGNGDEDFISKVKLLYQDSFSFLS